MSQTTDMLSELKYAPTRLGRVLILGLGKSGKACARYCSQLLGTRIDALCIAAEDAHDEDYDFIRGLGNDAIEIQLGDSVVQGSFDLCIASPGISQFSDYYQQALSISVELISEVEFAWRESKVDSQWVAITGTNGKTTTTALTAHILAKKGLRASAVGNIGDTCLDAVQDAETDIFVAEVSSYQLASTTRFCPDVAVLLNITPDHIIWHKSFGAYKDAKLKLFAHCKEGATKAILNAVDDESRSLVKELRAQQEEGAPVDYLPIGTAKGLSGDMRKACGSRNAAFIEDGRLWLSLDGQDHPLGSVDALKIKGEHNLINILAAAAVAISFEVDDACVREALGDFEALEHRIEACGTVGGVVCYNDSKATNVDATLQALKAFDGERPIVILGGYDKGTDLDELVESAADYAKTAICIGAAGPRFFEAFQSSSLPVSLAANLEEGFDEALKCAEAGDIIILSPACASFDEFGSFEERGTAFKELVAKRSEERGV